LVHPLERYFSLEKRRETTTHLYRKGKHVHKPVVSRIRSVRTAYEEGRVIFTIKHKGDKPHCPVCGSRALILRGCSPRRFRMVPIGSTAGGLQTLRCRPSGSYTRGFERYVLELSKHMTILDVARHLHVSWDTIKDIQKRYLKKKFSRPVLKDLRYLAIDETAVKKGHNYVTVALDLESGAVVFVGDGKGVDALEPFWKRLSYSATVEAPLTCLPPT